MFSIIVGGGILWYASQFKTDSSTIGIIHNIPKVLGEETKNINVPAVNTNEPIVEEKAASQPVASTGMSSSEVSGLFLTYYNRGASQDELNWWSGRNKSELESNLKSHPLTKDNNQSQQTATNTNTNSTPTTNTNATPTPTPTVDPAIKIELCKSEADTAKIAAKTTCTNSAMEAFRADPNNVMALKESSKCNTKYSDIFDPSARNSLINQCVSMYTQVMSDIKSGYLTKIPACTDAVYQNTYTECLNK